MGTKHIWVCEDCLSENLEKRPNGDIQEYITPDGDKEDYCLDCESFTKKINRGMIADG
jgi:hypothetical protein